MANIRLRYVKAYVDRHGKARHYFRKPGCKPVALPGLPGSDEFMAAYSAALANSPRVEVAATRTRAGSVGAMVAGYLGSAAFHNLAPISQQRYRRILDRLRREHGDRSIATLERRHVIRMSISTRAMCTPAAVTALTALVTSCCRNVDGARAMASYREAWLRRSGRC